jgi:hypothetical protein
MQKGEVQIVPETKKHKGCILTGGTDLQMTDRYVKGKSTIGFQTSEKGRDSLACLSCYGHLLPKTGNKKTTAKVMTESQS